MLRIGLLLSGPVSSRQALDLVQWAKAEGGIDVALVICPRPRWRTGLSAALARLAWKAILPVEKRIIRSSRFYRDHFATVDLAPYVEEQIVIAARDPRAAETLRAARLDVLVRLHPVDLDPALAGAARYGLLALNDTVANDSASPTLHGYAGLGPCSRGAPRTTFSVVREAAGAREPCMTGAFATEWSFALNQAALTTKSLVYVKDALRRLVAGEMPPARPGLTAAPERAPGLFGVLTYGARLALRILRRRWISSRGLKSRWSVAIGRDGFDTLDPASLPCVHSPVGTFWADPFLWSRDGRTHCFLEEYPFETSRGIISVLEVGPDGVTSLGPVVQEAFHLSFPYLFEHDGRLYMIPETAEARQVRLYICDDYPLRWRLRGILMDNVAAADTMVFHHGDRWWLITTFDRAEVDDLCNELNVFWADDPLAADWTPHPMNAIMVDSFGGRNAGMRSEAGRLYRFAQRQGFDQYGEGLMIFEIEELTPTAYRETLRREILPTFAPGLVGVHHLSFGGGTVAMDQLRMERIDR